MASISETGHAKNIANLNEMIRRCLVFGPLYNPSDVSIQIPSLQTKSTTADTALASYKDAKAALTIAAGARDQGFSKLRSLATRVVSAFEASRAPAGEVENLKSYNRRLTGRRARGVVSRTAAPPVAAPAGGAEEGPGRISVSRQSFDSLIDNFDQMVRIVQAEPLYAPNEADLQVSSLVAYLNELRTTHAHARDAAAACENAKRLRDQELYANETGITFLAAQVKKYVKALFGAKSDEYVQLSKLKFS